MLEQTHSQKIQRLNPKIFVVHLFIPSRKIVVKTSWWQILLPGPDVYIFVIIIFLLNCLNNNNKLYMWYRFVLMSSIERMRIKIVTEKGDVVKLFFWVSFYCNFRKSKAFRFNSKAFLFSSDKFLRNQKLFFLKQISFFFLWQHS